MREKLHVALIPAVALAGLAALALGTAVSWADALWLAWFAIFAIFEGNAIANETEGDTLSERLRVWYRVRTPAGKLGLTATIVALASWLIPHLILG